MESNIINEIESRYRSNPLHGVTFSIDATAYDCTDKIQFGTSETEYSGGNVHNYQDIIYKGKVIGWCHEYQAGRLFDPMCVQFCYPLADCTEHEKCEQLEKRFAKDPHFYNGETYRLNFATLQQLIDFVKASEESTTDTNQESTTDRISRAAGVITCRIQSAASMAVCGRRFDALLSKHADVFGCETSVLLIARREDYRPGVFSGHPVLVVRPDELPNVRPEKLFNMLNGSDTFTSKLSGVTNWESRADWLACFTDEEKRAAVAIEKHLQTLAPAV